MLARLGSSPEDLTRLGSSAVLRGNGLVAKFGAEDRCAREAFIFEQADALLPIDTPALVDSGPGWILMKAIEGEPAAPGDVRGLERLAPMHELFEGATGIDGRFRDVFGREREELLVGSRACPAASGLPDPLAAFLADPSRLFALVDEEPRTLVHGDAWYGNVMTRGSDSIVWLDWEEAGAGPAAFDLAMWLYGSPWAPGSMDPERDFGAYLMARTAPVEPRAMKRAVDAAAVLSFLLLDLANLTEGEPELTAGIVERRNQLVSNTFD